MSAAYAMMGLWKQEIDDRMFGVVIDVGVGVLGCEEGDISSLLLQ